MESPNHNRTEQSPTGDGDRRRCHAVVEVREDRPDLCTIYSIAPGDSLSTTWLTAAAGSFESLEACR